MKVRFLGTGTSCGVPMPTCQCEVCKSKDPHDNRLRASIFIETDDQKHILIDCGPDFRQQALAADIKSIDALLITHIHFDHCAGLDDLRAYSFKDCPLVCYAEEMVANIFVKHYDYIFVNRYPGVPSIDLHTISDKDIIKVGENEIIPIRVFHGKLPILGYRIGNLAYITDCTKIEDSEWGKLEGIDTLIIDALRWTPHPTHWMVSEAMEAVKRICPRKTYFTHMSHEIGLHEEANKKLEKDVQLAFDGLEIFV
ncbi:MAG: MBL fold metallo-hydrolase [Bacteroidales bacterium]|nr:MBL fold metallo-hydrolase [Bacteroidales bacterium]